MSTAGSGEAGVFTSSVTQSDALEHTPLVFGMHTANVARISSGTALQAARQLESWAASMQLAACCTLQLSWHAETPFASGFTAPDEDAPDEDASDDIPDDEGTPDDDVPPPDDPSVEV